MTARFRGVKVRQAGPSISAMSSFEVPDAKRSGADVMFHGHRFLLRAGLAIGNVFAWIFVFDYFVGLSGSVARAFAGVLIMYALSQAITVMLTPVAAAHLRRGTRSALVWALLLSASAFVILGATLGGLFNGTESALWGIAAFAIFLGAYRALYFIPYELNRANTEGARPRDRLFYELLLALVPAFAGATLLTETYAPVKLLFGAAAFSVIAALPVLFIPNIHERFSFSYAETFRELFTRRNNRILRISFLEGAQGAALLLVWPLAVFLIVGGSYATLGIVFSVTLLCILLIRIIHRNLVPEFRRQRSLSTHVTFAVSGWVARFVTGSALGVIIADAYAYSTHPVRGTSVDPFVFEQSADAGSFIDEYTALKEIGLAIGRISFAVIIGTFVFLAPIIVAFAIALLLAAVSAGISVSLARRHEAAQ